MFVFQPAHEITIYRHRREENLSSEVGADQPAHPRSLISAFVIRFSESSKSKLATGEISIFLLVSVADETGLSLVLSETPKASFLATRPNYGTSHIVDQ